MSSLPSFNPAFMSLVAPHPLWTTAGSSPSKVAMATVTAVMVSGRYATEALSRHWTFNLSGVCLLSPDCKDVVEDLPHVIKTCPALNQVRVSLSDYTRKYTKEKVDKKDIRDLILTLSNPTSPYFFQYLLDCSCLPPVVQLVQQHGRDALHHLFAVSRTWTFVLHRERLKILGRWNASCLK